MGSSYAGPLLCVLVSAFFLSYPGNLLGWSVPAPSISSPVLNPFHSDFSSVLLNHLLKIISVLPATKTKVISHLLFPLFHLSIVMTGGALSFNFEEVSSLENILFQFLHTCGRLCLSRIGWCILVFLVPNTSFPQFNLYVFLSPFLLILGQRCRCKCCLSAEDAHVSVSDAKLSHVHEVHITLFAFPKDTLKN